MAAYYNEIDPYAAEWLRNLIKAGHIADGEVDTRSIVDVKPNELRSFTQCHFFAGIAGWSHALRLAGWADDRKIWTGSCPCQPFSVAGKGAGVNDERHLWPHFFRLIREVRPPVVMGEQVAGAAGYGWLDGVRSDLESESYSCEGVDIPACAVNTPHIRQRLYWVANANSGGCKSTGERRSLDTIHAGGLHDGMPTAERDTYGKNDMADTATQRRQCQQSERSSSIQQAVAGERKVGKQFSSLHSGLLWNYWHDVCVDMVNSDTMRELQPQGSIRNERGWVGDTSSSDLANANLSGSSRQCEQRWQPEHQKEAEGSGELCAGRSGFWDNAIWLNEADGKTRRAQPGVRLLAHGVPARVGKLRAYGNAIVPQVAAEVIRAFMSVYP